MFFFRRRSIELDDLEIRTLRSAHSALVSLYDFCNDIYKSGNAPTRPSESWIEIYNNTTNDLRKLSQGGLRFYKYGSFFSHLDVIYFSNFQSRLGYAVIISQNFFQKES